MLCIVIFLLAVFSPLILSIVMFNLSGTYKRDEAETLEIKKQRVTYTMIGIGGIIVQMVLLYTLILFMRKK